MRRLLIFLVAIAVVAGLWWYANSQPLRVDTAEVTRGPVRSFVEEEGRTRVIDRFVVSAPVAGRLHRLTLREGDPVKQGDVIAEIDPVQLKARIAEAEAQMRALAHRVSGVKTQKPKPEELEKAQLDEERRKDALEVAKRELDAARAAEEKAKKDLVRAQEGLKDGTSSQETLDDASAAEEQKREQFKAAEIQVRIREVEIQSARLETAVLKARLDDFDWQEKQYREEIAALDGSLVAVRDDLKRTRVTAPTTGVVLRRSHESQQVVTAGTSILEIGDLGKLEIEADFLSEDTAHMRKDMPVEIFGRALGDTELVGKVVRIYPSAFRKISSLGVEQQRVTVVIGFDASKARLGDQYRVEVRVVLDRRDDVVLVPEGALFRHAGAWHVFMAEDGRAVLTKVETGIRDGRVREVKSGLAKGDEVVLHPDEAVTDDARIERMD